MIGIFNEDIFNEGIFNTDVLNGGIGLELGIGLASRPPAPVDFVIFPRTWSNELPRFQDTLRARNVVNMETLRVAKREKAEMREMANLYSAWKAA